MSVLVLDIDMKFAGDADELPIDIATLCENVADMSRRIMHRVGITVPVLRELMPISLRTHSVHNTNPQRLLAMS